MRTHRGTLLTLAGLLAVGAGSAAAQAGATQDSTAMTLIVAVFPGETGADQPMATMTSGANADHVASYAVVSKDAKGNVKVRKHGKGKHTMGASRCDAGKVVDGAVALLQHPVNSGDNYTTGSQACISKGNVDQIIHVLIPQSSAIVFVVVDADAPAMDSAMHQANASNVVDAHLSPQ